MNTYIQAAIDARKNLIFNNCTNVKIKHFTYLLFEKIEKLAETCKNVEEFENKFLESDLYERYRYIYEKTNNF